MAVTRRVCMLVFLAFCWSSIIAQNTDCGSLLKPDVVQNLHNLSVGLSHIHELQNLALGPLIAQPRVPGTRGSRLARTHIKTWMTAVGWTVEEDRFYDYTPYGVRRFSNVIATLDPGKAYRVVLACHYDSKVMHGARFVGATDSAVPCALLMDAALRLQTILSTNSNSDLTLQFIFFDGEEAFLSWNRRDSLYGSRHLAQKWTGRPGRNHLQNIVVFILLDLIGTPDTHFKLRFQQTAPVYNKLQRIESCLWNSNRLNPTDNPSPLFTSLRSFEIIADDHIPFLQRGVPVVHLITSPFPSVWHTPSDDLSALDFNRIDNLARILRVFLADLTL